MATIPDERNARAHFRGMGIGGDQLGTHGAAGEYHNVAEGGRAAGWKHFQPTAESGAGSFDLRGESND